MALSTLFTDIEPFTDLRHEGVAIKRGDAASIDADVTGDPCVVWDPAIASWRMFYFAQYRPQPGVEHNSVAHAVARDPSLPGAGDWEKCGRVAYENPEVVGMGAHKPWILQDARRPNHAVKVNGMYMLFVVTYVGNQKVIHIARSAALAGPWRIQEAPLVERGTGSDFDAYHVDTVTAYWMENESRVLIFYKGYPREPQRDQPTSPYGSSTGAALYDPDTGSVEKLGKVIVPGTGPHHVAGWVSTVQLLPAADKGWYGLITGSSTPPESPDIEPDMREPAPSLGTWAYTPSTWPVDGWRVFPDPIVSLDDVPDDARRNGETVNLWRHHYVVLDDQSVRLFYNAGPYGSEQMFCRSGYLASGLRLLAGGLHGE